MQDPDLLPRLGEGPLLQPLELVRVVVLVLLGPLDLVLLHQDRLLLLQQSPSKLG